MAAITVLIAISMLYVYVLALLSWRGPKVDTQGSDDMFFVILVPALNEEFVIGRTLRSLLAMRGNFMVLVIDDNSDDDTVAAIQPFLEDTRLRLLQQPPEEARQGKGHVLNCGLAAVRNMQLAELRDPDNVVVLVFDSDARVEPNFLEAVSPYFREPDVVGVQTGVRMYNADQNLLTLWQHVEFSIWGRVFGKGKNVLGSATLGGNGQCVRLSALTALGSEPWQSTSLTEDLELSLRLLMRDGQVRFCSEVSVWQEAVPRLRALIRQRGRWLQGHVQCWQHLPALLRSRLPLRAKVDLLVFMLLSAVVMPVGLIAMYSWLRMALIGGSDWWSLSSSVRWYGLSFGMVPLIVWSWRQSDGIRVWRLLVHAHMFIFYSLVWLMCALAMYWHVVRGRRSWAKTARVAPQPVSLPTPIPRPARSGASTFRPTPVGTTFIAVQETVTSGGLLSSVTTGRGRTPDERPLIRGDTATGSGVAAAGTLLEWRLRQHH